MVFCIQTKTQGVEYWLMDRILFSISVVILFLLTSGCSENIDPIQPTASTKDNNLIQPNLTSSPTPSVPPQTVTFTFLASNDLPSLEPKQKKELFKKEIGDLNNSPVTLEFFSDDPDPQSRGSTYGYVRYQNQYYTFGDVTSSYGFSSVILNNLLQDDKKSGVVLFTSVGTPFTETKLIGYNFDSKKFVSWEVSGEVECVNLGDKSPTLVSVFKGAHLNSPNVSLLLVHNNQLEQADLCAALVAESVRIVNTDNSSHQLEITMKGKVPQRFFYKDGKLVPI